MRTPDSAASPRILNVILGAWLFISAFLWPHSQAQMTNTWILGILAVVFALVSMYVAAQARYLNTLLAIWLFISAFALPRVSVGTVWNNAIVAILMFIVSLLPARGAPLRRATVT
jgi:SPW repeat